MKDNKIKSPEEFVKDTYTQPLYEVMKDFDEEDIYFLLKEYGKQFQPTPQKEYNALPSDSEIDEMIQPFNKDVYDLFIAGKREGAKWMRDKATSMQNTEIEKFKRAIKSWKKEEDIWNEHVTELQGEIKELENRNEQLSDHNSILSAESILIQNNFADTHGKLLELQMWKDEAVNFNGRWNKVYEFIQNHKDVDVGESVAEKALQFIKERDLLKAETKEMSEWNKWAAEIMNKQEAEIKELKDSLCKCDYPMCKTKNQ